MATTLDDGPTKAKTLKSHLVGSLAGLACNQRLELTVLSSVPKRTNALFPHTANPPRCFEKEFLVILAADESYTPTARAVNAEREGKAVAEDAVGDAVGDSTSAAKRAPVEDAKQQEEQNGCSAAQKGGKTGAVSQSDGPGASTTTTSSTKTSNDIAPTSGDLSSAPIPSPRPILIVALQAYLYILPGSSLSILYISKVDTSGYSTSRLSLTKTLISSFIGYHLGEGRTTSNVKIALFARSQGQYLFPNSIQSGSKRVGGGLKLCGWWKGVYEEVARRLQPEPGRQLTLSYLLPSYSADEALGMLGQPRTPLPDGVKWSYGPPFRDALFRAPGKSPQDSTTEATDTGAGQNTTTLATGNTPGTDRNVGLAWSIPALPDDPKTRFMDELVLDQMSQVGRGSSKRAVKVADVSVSQGSSGVDGPGISGNVLNDDDQASDSDDEPAITTIVSSSSNGLSAESSTPAPVKRTSDKRIKEKQRQGEERRKAENALNKVSPEEFWERMGFRQECASGDVTGFFHLDMIDSGPAAPSASTPRESAMSQRPASETSSSMKRTTPRVADTPAAGTDPVKDSHALRPAIVERIHKSLLNCDFANIHYAVEGTAIWQRSTKAIITGETGNEGWEACSGVVVPKEGVEAAVNERREEVTMLQPRKKQKVEVNTLQPRKREAVNMLQPRKK